MECIKHTRKPISPSVYGYVALSIIIGSMNGRGRTVARIGPRNMLQLKLRVDVRARHTNLISRCVWSLASPAACTDVRSILHACTCCISIHSYVERIVSIGRITVPVIANGTRAERTRRDATRRATCHVIGNSSRDRSMRRFETLVNCWKCNLLLIRVDSF